jgi:hypothetical protein
VLGEQAPVFLFANPIPFKIKKSRVETIPQNCCFSLTLDLNTYFAKSFADFHINLLLFGFLCPKSPV